MSTSKTGRPSSMPVTVGSIAGCEGGAVTDGNLLRSIPSSAFNLISSAGDTEVAGGAVVLGVARGHEIGVLVGGGWIAGGLAGPPRSRGVYSVVNDGPGSGARTRDVEYGVYIRKVRRKRRSNLFGEWYSHCVGEVCLV